MKSKVCFGDCRKVMKKIPDNFIDLIITSPPYDNLRTYENEIKWNFKIFKQIVKELYRVLKPGGVIVWVVGDATIKGSETGTSFRQALYFKKLGLNIHDTMIYRKKNYVPLTHRRYEQCFEYMFIFSKGKLKTFNPFKIPCKGKGKLEKYGFGRRTNLGSNHSMRVYKKTKYIATKETKIKSNIFSYIVGKDKTGHPGPFPQKLAKDHILTWSNKGDIVLDPMAGSGTVGIECQNLNRKFILIDKVFKYYNLMKKRLIKNKKCLKKEKK